MAVKTKKKQNVKSKTSSKTVKKTAAKSKASAKKPVAKKSTAKAKPVKKAVKKPVQAKKAVKKPAPKKVVAKKPAPKAAKKPILKAVKKAPAPAKPAKAVKVAAPKPEKKVTARKKKPTKMDKKVARTLVKIANANKTAVANVGVKSAAMAALKATVALSAANVNAQPAALPQPANVNQPAKEAKGEKPAFKAGDMVVYPAHGVGKVDGIESHTVGGMEVKLFKITFDHERMTLKVPMQRATGSGLRQLSNKETMKNVFETMKGRPRIRRVMWSRRAQEYEQKINSGDPVAIAEVLRDLRRNAESGEQSYSERQIFNNALERLAREVAAIDKVPQEKAVEKLHNLLVRSKNTAPIVSNDDDAEDAA